MRNLAWVVGILGIWMIVAAFLTFASATVMWHNLIIGLVVGIAGYNMIEKLQWQSWVSMIVGLWLVISAFMPEMRIGEAFLWNALITGILLAVSGFGTIAEKGVPKEVKAQTG